MVTNNYSKRKNIICKSKFNKTIKRKRKIIGGSIDYILEDIYHYCNEDYNEQFPDDKRDPVNGEFVVHKEFKIKSKNNPRKRKIFGYVIQKVEKTTDAYIIKDNKENKIANISKFTNNFVNYMNDSYYELFFIIDGLSSYGDNFQNGAILEYTYDNSNGTYGPDDRTDTKGIITVKGTSSFILANEKEVKSNQNIVNSEMNINNVENSINILGINWLLDKKSPANGLPFILIEEGKEIQTLKRDSNVLEHIVEVKWDTTKKIDGISESFTKSTFKQIA
jgi:hypothetical protein